MQAIHVHRKTVPHFIHVCCIIWKYVHTLEYYYIYVYIFATSGDPTPAHEGPKAQATSNVDGSYERMPE